MTDLSFARLAELAPAPNWKLIDRYLPEPYRRALDQFDNPMGKVTKSSRDALRRISNELELVQKSRALDFYPDLSDGRRLGALHAQEPWPEEDNKAFRARLKGVAALAFSGAANARRFVDVAALATSSSVGQVIPPNTSFSVSEGATGLSGQTVAGQTKGILIKADGALHSADVIDAPSRLYHHDVIPSGADSYTFSIDNPASANLPDLLLSAEALYPNPLITITTHAASRPLALVQRDTGRIVIINRAFKAGSVVQVDLQRMTWANTDGPASTAGPITIGGTKEALYAGITSTTEDRFFVNEETADDAAAGYALDARLKADIEITQSLADPMIEHGNTAAISPMVMPSWLGHGQSRWRLLQVDTHAGVNELHDLTFTPLPPNAPVDLAFDWVGRRAGEFAVRADDPMLAPDQTGPLKHRKLWLDQMVERFKLGGTVRIANELLVDPAMFGLNIVSFDLTDSTRAADTITLFGGFEIADTVRPVDAFSLSPETVVDLADNVTPLDSVVLASDEAGFAFAEAVSAADVISLAPELVIDGASTATPGDAIDMTSDEVRLGATDGVTVTDDLVFSPEMRPDFTDGVKPGDTLDFVAVPTVEVDATEPVKPGDALDFKAVPFFELDSQDTTKPGDRMEFKAVPIFRLDGQETVKPRDTIDVIGPDTPPRDPPVDPRPEPNNPTDVIGRLRPVRPTRRILTNPVITRPIRRPN